MKFRSALCLGVVLTTTSLRADIAALQQAAANHPDLLHQYSFDGEDETTRLADSKGTAPLTPRPAGQGTPGDLQFGVAGFDDSSTAVQIFRGPGADLENGTGLHAGNVTLGETVSFEVILRPDQDGITGGVWNLGYVLATRVDNNRGYFLVQGDAPLPSDGGQLSSTLGNGYSQPNQNLLLDQVEPGHWYYIAGSYRINADTNNVTFTNYLADLTAGDTELQVIGPFTNSGGTYPTGSSPLGIGGRWDAGENFPGAIDEVTLYNAELSQETFQAHLDLLTGGNDLALDVGVTGDELTFRWASRDGKQYHLRSSLSLESDPATWDQVEGQTGLKATPPQNTITIPRPADPSRFYVIEEFTPPPVIVFADNFDEGFTGWSTGPVPADTSWELGVPDFFFGPLASFSGPNCYGTDLDGEYTSNTNSWLLSPTIDLTGLTKATLRFQQYKDLEDTFDASKITVLDDQTREELVVLSDSKEGSDPEWRRITLALPEEALGRKIRLEFRMIADEAGNLSGWYIDDVELSSP